ncbi:NADH dehydrogenase 1 alpha subcomplex assembly factor 3 [Lentinula edodes]|nr:NADH dehydrogenase 1 alpha subcomplex assembly factor 3 [Lentinula edodes]
MKAFQRIPCHFSVGTTCSRPGLASFPSLLISRTKKQTYIKSVHKHTVTVPSTRTFHSTSSYSNNGPTAKAQPFTNILASDVPPPVQVASISPSGIELTDGLIIPGACIFLEGKVFLWDPPKTFWEGWKEEHFDVFEVVVPKPEILLLGTGKTIFQPPPYIREHLNKMGIQLDVMDTRNACSTYNLLSEEGRRVAAALLPLAPLAWQKKTEEIPKSSAMLN